MIFWQMICEYTIILFISQVIQVSYILWHMVKFNIVDITELSIIMIASLVPVCNVVNLKCKNTDIV